MTLNEILAIQSYTGQQERMTRYLKRLCRRRGYQLQEVDGSLYIQKGSAATFPCVVAHLDTVHKLADNLTVVEVGGKLTGLNAHTMTQTGIGGDDKVGIYIALKCLERFPALKVAFFRDEECGCHGSYGAELAFFSDCGHVLQCDRRGAGDFVTNASGVPLSDEAFQDAVAPLLTRHGYTFCPTGGMTDVQALKEIGLEVACANLSCGYHNPHQANEYVVVREVENTLALVCAIIQELGAARFPHHYDYVPYYPGYAYEPDVRYQGVLWTDREEDECGCCGTPKEYATGALAYNRDYALWLCPDCATYAANW